MMVCETHVLQDIPHQTIHGDFARRRQRWQGDGTVLFNDGSQLNTHQGIEAKVDYWALDIYLRRRNAQGARNLGLQIGAQQNAPLLVCRILQGFSNP